MFNRKEEFIYIYNYMQNNNYKKNLCILSIENNNHYNLIIHKSENKLINDLNFNLFHNFNNKDSIENSIKNNYEFTEETQISIHPKKFLIDNVNDDDNSEKINGDNSIYYKKKQKDIKDESNILTNEYQFKIDKKIDLILSKYNNLSKEEIINNLNKINRIIKYGDIFAYLYNKQYNENINLYPESFKEISDKNKRNNKKRQFSRSCKNFIINKENRLIQKRKFRNLFDGKIY